MIKPKNKLKIHKSIKISTATLLAALFVIPWMVKAAEPSLALHHYLVQLRPGVPQQELGLAGNVKLRFTQTSSSIFSNIYSFDSQFSLASLRQMLAGEFTFLETDRSLSVDAGLTTNDPGFTANPANIDKQWGLAKTGFDQAWTQTIGSYSNIVAVVDTGIDYTHEDLQNITPVNGFDFTTNLPIVGRANSDDNGHGTLVAGILGATPNNGIGVVGANWKISLMAIKALNSSGQGDSAAVAESIVWAADHGAGFINLSLGGIGFGHDTALANAIAYAFNKNAVIVAAAGNDAASSGGNLDQQPVYPICDDNNNNEVIGVAATDQNDLKPAFSNYGRNCVDVDAPGKRILSTINHDPLTGNPSPNSYAYASGTSLAVPFVVGQAALIKALYPFATNAQIRDRIISTADPIDDLNLTQCGGQSCHGLLGAGRINVPNSLAQVIAMAVSEGDLVRATDTGIIYLISGGQKRPVSTFVLNQRFLGVTPKSVLSSQLSSFPEGPYTMPTDGTLAKLDAQPAVYYISAGFKDPVTFSVFQQRGFNFSSVQTVSFTEFNSWPAGNFLPPAEGTLLRTVRNKTVYWVVGGVLHPINFAFYMDKGLNVFPVLTIPDSDINGFARGEAYIR
jgi:hypothetical protein